MIKALKNRFFKKRSETRLEFIAGLIGCWLLTVATAIIVDSFFSVEIGVATIVFQTLIFTVLIALLSRRWWILLIGIGVIFIPLIAVVIFNDNGQLILKAIWDFIKWWAARLPQDSPWHSFVGFYLVHTFINIGLVILYFVIFRLTRRSWPLVLLALGVLVTAFAFGYTEYDIWAIPFLVAGIFPFIASEKFRNKYLPNFKNLFGLLGEKWLFAIIATVVCIVICLSSVSVAFGMGEDVRTRYFTDVVSDIQTVTKLYTKEQKALQVSLYDIGLSSDRSFVGGSIRNLSSATLAYTDLTEPTFVKIAAYDTFDGYNWKNTSDNSYRVNGPWKEQEENYLASRLVNDDFLMKLAESSGYKKTVNVYMTRASHIFPIIGQAHNFKETTPNKNQLLFDKTGRLISYYGQEEGFTYSFDTIIYDSKDTILKEQLKYVIPIYNNTTDPLYVPDSKFFEVYTKPYANQSQKVEGIIKSLGFDVHNYYDKAYTICELFSQKNGFVYNENTPQFQKGDNIVDKLFETKQGHCVYYATAMISLTRAAGIPSRLAAGYRTVESSKTGTQAVDRANPYAWVECYIPHIGWVSFDPTPKRTARPIGRPGFSGAFPSDLDLNYIDDVELKTSGTVLEWDGGPDYGLIITIPLIVLLVAAIIFNTVFSPSFYRLATVRKRFKDTRGQLRFYHLDMLRQFYWLGFPLKKGETISELTARVCDKLSNNYAEQISQRMDELVILQCGERETLEAQKQSIFTAREALESALAVKNANSLAVITDGIEVIEQAYYAGLTPTDSQIQAVFDARLALEKELKNKNNPFSYTIKRRLLLPIFNPSFKMKVKPKRNKRGISNGKN